MVCMLSCIFCFQLPAVAQAGELECFLTCKIDGLMSNITWKPSGCSKPSAPLFLVGRGAREYNLAVDQFNMWLSLVERYNDCIRSEALADIKRMPDLIVEGAKKAQSEMASEIQHQRSNLQLMRP